MKERRCRSRALEAFTAVVAVLMAVSMFDKNEEAILIDWLSHDNPLQSRSASKLRHESNILADLKSDRLNSVQVDSHSG